MAKDDAPWLAEATPTRTRVSRRSMFITIASALALIAAVAIGAFLLLTRQDQTSGDGYMEAEQAPLIAAEAGPYKVPPEDPMGLDVEGQDQTLYAAGIGIDETSNIDTASVPEEPLPRPGTAKDLLPPAMQTAPLDRQSRENPPETTPDLPRKDPVLPPPVPRKLVISPRSSVQLGAFSSRERAEAAWAALVARHGLIGVSPQYSAIERDGKTLWRLRATGGNAPDICARLTKSGDGCTVVSE
jgi:hypothetical protein